jgi:hypothetical protein
MRGSQLCVYAPRLQFSAASVATPSLTGFPASSECPTGAFNYVRYVGARRVAFVTGGLGFSVFSTSLFSDTSTKFAGNFGGGVDIQLHRRVYLRGELRDFVTQRPELAFRGTTHNIVPSLALAFRLR